MHIPSLDFSALNRIPWQGGEGRPLFFFSLPLVDIQGYWVPTRAWPEYSLPWNLQVDSCAQSDYPALAFVNTKGECRALVALSQLRKECRIQAKLNQEACTYDIQVECMPSREPVALTVDCRPQGWIEA